MKAFGIFIWMAFLTGLVYPLLVTGIAQLAMPGHSNGSIVFKDKQPIGSALIAQPFKEKHYFWPRPSFVGYQTLPAGASHWAPTSMSLVKNVQKRKEMLKNAFSIQDERVIPAELLFNSASGIDPHISPQCAYFQAARVAEARDIDKKLVDQLIKRESENWQKGLLGPPCVNVLKLNLALDRGI